MTTLREQRAAEEARRSAEARARLLSLLGENERAASFGDADEAVTGLVKRETAQKAAEAEQPRVRAALGPVGPRWDEAPTPDALPQSAKPPPHVPVNAPAEERAAKVGRANAGAAGRRETEAAWLPAWVRLMALRMGEGKGRCLAELSALPGHARDGVLAAAKPYGGADSTAGRACIVLGVVLWHLGGRLRGMISGLPRAAYTSLTVGWRGQHYSHSAVWHPIHDAHGDIEPELRGTGGGMIGAGRNRGFMVALMARCRWLRVHVPPISQVPSWMVATSGWPFVQLLIDTDEPPPS